MGLSNDKKLNIHALKFSCYFFSRVCEVFIPENVGYEVHEAKGERARSKDMTGKSGRSLRLVLLSSAQIAEKVHHSLYRK
jgi:hypothetical protein